MSRRVRFWRDLVTRADVSPAKIDQCTCPEITVGGRSTGIRNMSAKCPVHREEEAEAYAQLFEDQEF